MQDQCQIVASRGEARCQLDAMLEQRLGVTVAAQSAGDLRQHAQRGDIAGCAPEVCSQQRLSFRQAVCEQGRAGSQQGRIARRTFQMMRIGEVGVLPIAYFGVQDAELQPCRSEMRIERDGAPQRRQSRLASAGTTQSHTKLEVRGGGLWRGAREPGRYWGWL